MTITDVHRDNLKYFISCCLFDIQILAFFCSSFQTEGRWQTRQPVKRNRHHVTSGGGDVKPQKNKTLLIGWKQNLYYGVHLTQNVIDTFFFIIRLFLLSKANIYVALLSGKKIKSQNHLQYNTQVPP